MTIISKKPASLFDVQKNLKHGYAYYDSVQNALPANKRDDLIQRYVNRNILINAYATYDQEPYNFIPKVISLFLHSFSKIFFISLPIFAFFLYLLYIRKKNKLYYVSHAIFSIHYYSMVFIFFFLLLPFLDYYNFSEPRTVEILRISAYTVGIGVLAYLYFAMLRFYKQGWLKTFIKFVILSAASIIIIVLLVIAMFVQSLAGVH